MLEMFGIFLMTLKILNFDLDGVQDLSEIAIGSGIGLRYDFDFFVFRFEHRVQNLQSSLTSGRKMVERIQLKKCCV